MVKKSAAILTICIMLMPLHAICQKFSFGAKVFLPYTFGNPSVIRSTLETTSRIDYYFADDVNSQYSLEPQDALDSRYILSPKFFIQWMWNDNWFIDYELGFTSFEKTYKITYNSKFIKDAKLDTKFEYGYLTNALYLGYKMWRKSEFRPKIYAGASYYSMLSFKEATRKAGSDKLVNNEPYGKVIHQQIETIKNHFPALSGGIGFEYYMLTVDIWYDMTFTNIDTGNGSFYKDFHSVYFALGFKFFNVLKRSKKVKRLPKEDR